MVPPDTALVGKTGGWYKLASSGRPDSVRFGRSGGLF